MKSKPFAAEPIDEVERDGRPVYRPVEPKPRRHLRLLRTAEWTAHVSSTLACPFGPQHPDLEWEISPLGAAVEVVRGSPEHLACETKFISLHDAYDSATVPGMVAEVAFCDDDLDTFLEFVERDAAALQHILDLQTAELIGESPDLPPKMQAAQHTVRTILARRAAQQAVDPFD